MRYTWNIMFFNLSGLTAHSLYCNHIFYLKWQLCGFLATICSAKPVSKENIPLERIGVNAIAMQQLIFSPLPLGPSLER